MVVNDFWNNRTMVGPKMKISTATKYENEIFLGNTDEAKFTVGEGGDYATWALALADQPGGTQISDMKPFSYGGIVPYIKPEYRPRSILDYPSTGDGFDRS